jgi:hypothetical protein
VRRVASLASGATAWHLAAQCGTREGLATVRSAGNSVGHSSSARHGVSPARVRPAFTPVGLWLAAILMLAETRTLVAR